MTLDRSLVLRIATEEALASRCALDELLHLSRRPEAKAARIRAWARIVAETNCRGSELAEAWGCDAPVIYRAFPERYPRARHTPAPSALPAAGYDQRTIGHLRWAHGDERMVEIIAGRDAATNADIAAWRSLGREAQS